MLTPQDLRALVQWHRAGSSRQVEKRRVRRLRAEGLAWLSPAGLRLTTAGERLAVCVIEMVDEGQRRMTVAEIVADRRAA